MYTSAAQLIKDLGLVIQEAQDKRNIGENIWFASARRFRLAWNKTTRQFIITPYKPQGWATQWLYRFHKAEKKLLDIRDIDIEDGLTSKGWQKLEAKIAWKMEQLGELKGQSSRLRIKDQMTFEGVGK